jgi:hypothetical protein
MDNYYTDLIVVRHVVKRVFFDQVVVQEQFRYCVDRTVGSKISWAV